MEFSNKLKEFSQRIEKMKDGIQTEEATKTSLVMPFFNLLGYDVFNPMEFCPEYTADVGIKKGEKVDYAILDQGEPLILIECKSCTDSLGKHSSQLFRYFGTSKARFGILTNGIVYKFFTDLEESNKMDLSPFLEVNLLSLKDTQINEIKKFCKENFDSDKVFSTASELKYSGLIKDYLSKQLDNPSEDFVKHILYYVYEGQRTQKVVEKYQPLVKKAFTSFINEIVNQKITSALTPEEAEDEAIKTAGGRNEKAVMAMLDMDTLKASKNQSEDIKKALETVKESDAYLFGTDEPFSNPVGATGGTGGNGGDNLSAIRAAMGLPAKKD